MTQHIPVLQREALSGAHIDSGATVIDATLGGGSYTRALLERVGPHGHVYALDRDKTAIERFMRVYPAVASRVTLIHANFADIQHIAHDRGVVPMAVVADLGVSSDQLDDPARGLSFQADGPLDMRLDQSGQVDADAPTAAMLLAECSAQELAHIFRVYGDEPFAMPIARAIVAARALEPLTTTTQLAELIVRTVPRRAQRLGKHPATRVFQALRIAVNHEYEDLERFLHGALDILAPGGYLSVVSFHSGEDRIVKQFMRAQSHGCVCPPAFPVCQCCRTPRATCVTTKPIVPTAEEIAANPRARSAKLRILRKK